MTVGNQLHRSIDHPIVRIFYSQNSSTPNSRRQTRSLESSFNSSIGSIQTPNDQESVYKLIPKTIIIPEKPPLYKSIYNPMASKEYKDSQVKKAASIGPAVVPKETPDQFLRKKSKSVKTTSKILYHF